MRERKAIGIFLLFSAFILLTTCQLQFNKSAGNSLALRVIIPGSPSGGGKSTPALPSGAKSLVNGTSLTVTISPPQGATQTLSTSIDGKTSIDFSFSLSSSGTYQVTVDMLDGSENLLSTVSTKLTVPTGNYPVVLIMPSNLLSAVLTDSNPTTYPFGFSPTTYTYSGASAINLPCIYYPLTLTLTTVDPNATITSVTEYWVDFVGSPTTVVDSHTGSTYTLTDTAGYDETVTIILTGQDGTTQTYTLSITYGGC